MAEVNRRAWVKWLIGLGGLVAIAAGIAFIAIPGDEQLAGQETESAANATDDEAAAQQEWEQRQQKILDVLQSMTRQELLAESPIKGNPEAAVTLIKFSDFQCPYCAVAAEEMDDFVGRHRDELRYVYKHLPLNQIHPEAMPSAKASWAAGQQDQFWAYHDALFANQDRLGEDLYVEIAEDLALDMEQFNRDRSSAAAQEAIDSDLALAQDLEIRGTPTFIMNGLLIPGGAPPEFFDTVLERMQALQEENDAPGDS